MTRLEHALSQINKVEQKPFDAVEYDKKEERQHRRLEFRRKCARCKTRWAYNRQVCTDCMTEKERAAAFKDE